jgi:hypothetical protein
MGDGDGGDNLKRARLFRFCYLPEMEILSRPSGVLAVVQVAVSSAPSNMNSNHGSQALIP